MARKNRLNVNPVLEGDLVLVWNLVLAVGLALVGNSRALAPQWTGRAELKAIRGNPFRTKTTDGPEVILRSTVAVRSSESGKMTLSQT